MDDPVKPMDTQSSVGDGRGLRHVCRELRLTVRAGTKLDRKGARSCWRRSPAGAISGSASSSHDQSAWIAWSSMPLPVWLRWSGAVFSALSVALLIWTCRLGRNLTVQLQHIEHTLVTRGPYRWIQHPFYVCMALSSQTRSSRPTGSSSCRALSSSRCWHSARASRKNNWPRDSATRTRKARTGRFLPKLRPTQ